MKHPPDRSVAHFELQGEGFHLPSPREVAPHLIFDEVEKQRRGAVRFADEKPEMDDLLPLKSVPGNRLRRE